MDPVADVVDRRVRGRRRGRRPAGLDDRRAALGDRRDELVAQPALLDLLRGDLAADLGVVQVRVLGGRVVAPDRHPGDLGDRHVELLRELGDRAVVVQAHHRGEAVRRDVRGGGAGDQGVRVRRVADDQHADVVRGARVDGATLRGEDAAVGLQQVSALHALGPRARADQQGDVHPVERRRGVVGDVDPGEQRERAVVELHRRALGGLHRLRDLQQAQPDRGVRPQQLAGGDAEEQRVADLPSGPGDGHDGG